MRESVRFFLGLRSVGDEWPNLVHLVEDGHRSRGRCGIKQLRVIGEQRRIRPDQFRLTLQHYERSRVGGKRE